MPFPTIWTSHLSFYGFHANKVPFITRNAGDSREISMSLITRRLGKPITINWLDGDSLSFSLDCLFTQLSTITTTSDIRYLAESTSLFKYTRGMDGLIKWLTVVCVF